MARKKRGINWRKMRNEAIAFGVFIFFIYFDVINWQNHEEIKREHERNAVTAVIHGKTANDSLFSGISYIALLEPDLTGKAVFKLRDNQYVRIPKELFYSVEIGESINGYEIQGVFMTSNELKYEYKWFYITLCLMALYPVGYIIYMLFKIRRLEAFVNRHDASLNKLIGTLFWGGITIALLIGYFHLAQDIKYGYDKFFSKEYIQTDALVTDTYADYNFQRYAESYFYVALTYTNEEGTPVYMTKEVTRSTFNKLDKQLRISYNKQNPYQVFSQQTTISDTINILMSNTVIIYLCMLFCTALLLFTLYLMKRKRKTGSYWKVTEIK